MLFKQIWNFCLFWFYTFKSGKMVWLISRVCPWVSSNDSHHFKYHSSSYQIKELSSVSNWFMHTYASTHTKRLETLFKRLFSCSLSSFPFVSGFVFHIYPLINLCSESLVMPAVLPRAFCRTGKRIGEFWMM